MNSLPGPYIAVVLKVFPCATPGALLQMRILSHPDTTQGGRSEGAPGEPKPSSASGLGPVSLPTCHLLSEMDCGLP